MKTTLIISTYNRPDALAVCLDSIRYQTILPDEVIIGDDGSTFETKETIERFTQDFPTSIVHIWQEDKGFRLAMMRNKSVAKATGDYIIEIDGDVFLHPRFVESHIKLAQPHYYLRGTRVNLGEELTNEICKAEKYRAISICTKGIYNKRINAIQFSWLSKLMATYYKNKRPSGLGCNLSFWKEDFLAINGYDELFEGWGGEDSDLAYRMERNGCRKKRIKFAGIAYHLWHGHEFMQNKEKNNEQIEVNNKNRVIRCLSGVSQYLEHSTPQ